MAGKSIEIFNGSVSTKTGESSSSDKNNKTRRRRAHQKSRRGCANCKLRRVRCGEEKPGCERCIAFGVLCDYGHKSKLNGGMLCPGESSFVVEMPTSHKVRLPPALSNNREVLSALNKCPDLDLAVEATRAELGAWMMGLRDLKLLSKFRDRTVLTLGTGQSSRVYQKEIIRLASGHAFLQHIMMALTLLHDRHLDGSTSISQETTLHWYKGTALFKDILMRPVKEHEKDALWMTAAMLGAMQFACIEANSPEEAWPLKDDFNDLDWLKMTDGKKAVWELADPSRPTSVFHQLSRDHHLIPTRPIFVLGSIMTRVTCEWLELFNIGPSSTAENNPYYRSALMLARLLDLECNPSTVIEFLTFMSHVPPELKQLIADKDPKALLLIACWFAKVYRYQWWIYRRGLMEGSAICIYLDQYHKEDTAIQSLLEYPKAAFGLVFPCMDLGTSKSSLRNILNPSL